MKRIAVRVMTLPVRSALRIAIAVAVLAPAAALGATAVEITPANSLESSLLAELNVVRTANGLQPLRLNKRLSAAANQHSTEMVEVGYFGHRSSDGSDFSLRIKRFYAPGAKRSWLVGENLAWQAPNLSANQAVREWLASPGHRENLLRRSFRDVGIAAIRASAAPGVFGGRRVLVLTVNFGTR